MGVGKWGFGVNSLGGGKQQINKPTITNNLFAKGWENACEKASKLITNEVYQLFFAGSRIVPIYCS